jgi:hypothetical protein
MKEGAKGGSGLPGVCKDIGIFVDIFKNNPIITNYKGHKIQH